MDQNCGVGDGEDVADIVDGGGGLWVGMYLVNVGAGASRQVVGEIRRWSGPGITN